MHMELPLFKAHAPACSREQATSTPRSPEVSTAHPALHILPLVLPVSGPLVRTRQVHLLPLPGQHVHAAVNSGEGSFGSSVGSALALTCSTISSVDSVLTDGASSLISSLDNGFSCSVTTMQGPSPSTSTA
jgi:hypothetical protein